MEEKIKYVSTQEILGEYSNGFYIHKYYKYTDKESVVTYYHTYEAIDAPWHCGADFDMSGLANCNVSSKKDSYDYPTYWDYRGTGYGYTPDYISQGTGYIPEACKNCPTHPSNGGSGICHCILGDTIIT